MYSIIWPFKNCLQLDTLRTRFKIELSYGNFIFKTFILIDFTGTESLIPSFKLDFMLPSSGQNLQQQARCQQQPGEICCPLVVYQRKYNDKNPEDSSLLNK